MKTTPTPEIGSISHGTLRPQDLIPAFLDAVETYAPAMIAPFPFVPAHVEDGGDSSDWWDSEEAQGKLDELFDILSEHAPDGCYFGAHEGDGSDFGFWPIDPEGDE